VNGAELYPDPPHISAVVWTPQPETDTFAQMCAAVEALGATPTGTVRTLPLHDTFHWLQGVDTEPQEVGDEFHSLVTGAALTDVRVVQAAFEWDGEPLVVEYSPARPPQIHPIAATLSGGLLGIPADLWDDTQRAAALALAARLRGLLGRAVAETGALYGSLEGESELAAPVELAEGAAIDSPLFVSTTLINADPQLLADLRDLRRQDQEISTSGGHLFIGWAPLRTDGGPSPYERDRNTATGRRMAQALRPFVS
jgi:hypothetical protein